MLQGVVYQLDAALESKDTQKHGLVFIYDMSDSKYQNFDYDLSQKILTLLKVSARLTRRMCARAAVIVERERNQLEPPCDARAPLFGLIVGGIHPLFLPVVSRADIDLSRPLYCRSPNRVPQQRLPPCAHAFALVSPYPSIVDRLFVATIL